MKTLFTLAALLLPALPASAQRRETAPAAAAPAVFAESARLGVRPSPALRIASRGGGAFLGMSALGVAGAFAGYQLTPRRAGGDDPGLEGLIAGLVVGGSVGAALGAALPENRARCGHPERFLRGLLGAAGTSAAFLAAQGQGGGEILVVFPIVTPLVAAVAADC